MKIKFCVTAEVSDVFKEMGKCDGRPPKKYARSHTCPYYRLLSARIGESAVWHCELLNEIVHNGEIRCLRFEDKVEPNLLL